MVKTCRMKIRTAGATHVKFYILATHYEEKLMTLLDFENVTLKG